MTARPSSTKDNAVAASGAQRPSIDRHRGRHLALAQTLMATEHGSVSVTIDEAESPLAWLARRRGSDGRAMIEPHQFQAGEKLRADFTCAHMMPRTTANWSSPIASGRRGASNGAAAFTDTMIAARQRVHQALDAAGPEFAGLLIDICCFLKRLEDIERERSWPARSAKVVLRLGLDRLARHYGFSGEASGRGHAAIRTWLAEGATFSVDGV